MTQAHLSEVTSSPFGCVGNTIKTFSGAYFDLANPTPESVCFDDIAYSLSKICRFGGQCPLFYSVAEHLVRCASLAVEMGAERECVRAVFAHDFEEAYIGDVVKPLKVMLRDYDAIARRVSAAIDQRFRVCSERYRPTIEQIDRAMLLQERNALFGDDGVVWSGQDDTLEQFMRQHPAEQFQYWSEGKAYYQFMDMASSLGGFVDGARLP